MRIAGRRGSVRASLPLGHDEVSPFGLDGLCQLVSALDFAFCVKFRKRRETPDGVYVDEAEESSDKYFPPDAALSKTILTSRMRSRYKDEGGLKQAIQINISGAEANL